jgi:hypothetical protein
MRVLFKGFSNPVVNGEYPNKFETVPRKPQNVPVQIHQIADAWFQQEFGIRARSRTLMCSTDQIQAASFAVQRTPAVITPIGSYSIIYSQQVRDFIQICHESAGYSEEYFHRWLRDQHYLMVDSTDKIEFDFFGEVMVSCQRYHIEVFE